MDRLLLAGWTGRMNISLQRFAKVWLSRDSNLKESSERRGLFIGDDDMFDSLSWRLRRNLPTWKHSGLSYWIVRVRLRDGREFRNVVINHKFKLDAPGEVPFRLRDVDELWWDGYRGSDRTMTPIAVAHGESI
jgi:hypothetical protein